MPTFSATKAYADDSALTEAALDNFKTGLETFFNTGIDSDNIKTAGINTVNLVDGSITLDKLTTEVTTRFVPAGTILAWYSYDLTAATPLSFSTAVYAYCDGATAVTVAGFTGTVSVPDMSDRYLIGFGTEGGKDIDTATWATAAIGDVSHTISVKAHTHGVGDYQFKTFYVQYVNSSHSNYYGYTLAGATSQMFSLHDCTDGGLGAACDTMERSGGGVTQTLTVYTKSGTGTSDNPTDTASIQPRSIRVRYLIKIA